MSPKRLTFVAFEPRNDTFVAFMPMEALVSTSEDPASMVRQAAKLYEDSIRAMRTSIDQIQRNRTSHTPTPARKIWELGNVIFGLCEELDRLSLQIDGLYEHLTRDLAVKRKWLEKVIILRRYLPDVSAIPESLSWGRCEKGTRKIAERLRDGHMAARREEP